MKIITKLGLKDYYDYLVGIYGIDEKLVYLRNALPIVRKESFVKQYSVNCFNQVSLCSPSTLEFAICGKLYVLTYFNNKVYYTPEEMVELFEDCKSLIPDKLYTRTGHILKNPDPNYGFETLKEATKKFIPYTLTNVNQLRRQPVLIKTDYYQDLPVEKSFDAIPLLSDFSIAKYISAEEIYKDISAFLGWLNDFPEIENTQTDKEKIVSKGFDLKKSFRHRK